MKNVKLVFGLWYEKGLPLKFSLFKKSAKINLVSPDPKSGEPLAMHVQNFHHNKINKQYFNKYFFTKYI